MTRAKALLIWFSCIGLFSLMLGCSQTITPSGPAPAVRPPAETTVKREFDAESDPHSAGKKILVANGCFRCHTVDSVRGPFGSGQDKRAGSLELGTTGADPKRTVEWFMAFIRNPRTQWPDTKMPSYEGKINEPDLRALAEYLASLK